MTKPDQKFIYLFIGVIFTVNSFITARIVDDGEFVSSLSALVAVVVLVFPMISSIIKDISTARMHMHELAVLAVFASCIQGDLRTSACIALFIFCSIIIETKTASGAAASLESLAKLSPDSAHRLMDDGSEEDVKGHLLKADDHIRVRPGESIFADGIITKGSASINEANITGESLPVDKTIDSQVYAGTLNLSGVLDIKVLKAGEDTTIGRVKELILKAQASKLPFVRIVDQYAHYYMPTIFMIAAAVLFFNRTDADGLSRVVALLVAACPVALILATPAAVVASLSAAARLGVLFKDVNDIEAMARTDAFIFDKTGTLTLGVLEVARLSPAKGVETSELLDAAALAESGSNHPVAKAVIALAKTVNINITTPENLHEEPGRGVKAEMGNDTIIAGNLNWVLENDASESDFADIEEARVSGMSLLFVIKNGNALGWIGLSDKEREEAGRCIDTLRSLGVRFIAMLSGDRNTVVDTVGKKLRIQNLKGECSPLDKVSYVDEIKQKGYQVAFIGDGVNDGPALAESHIGIAMGAAGSDVAIESATVALLNNELDRLPFILSLAKKMKLAVLQNFCIGCVIIAGGISLSAMGYLSPVLAAVFQVAGALAVAMNSAKLIRQGEELGR